MLLRNIRGHADEFMRLRDVRSFVLQNVDVEVNNDQARIDGCEGIMLIDTKLCGQTAKNIKYEGEPSMPVIISK